MAVPPSAVATIVITCIIAPLAAGVAVRMAVPRLAERSATLIRAVAAVLMVIAALLMLTKVGPIILAQIRDGTMVTIIAFALIGLAAGHLFGPPDEGDRTILAMATASRHPGIAIAIAHINYPEDKEIPAAVLLAFLVGLALTFPYMAWRKRMLAADPAGPSTG